MQTFDLTVKMQDGAQIVRFPPAPQPYGCFAIGQVWEAGGLHRPIVEVRHAVLRLPDGNWSCQVLLVVA